MYMYDLKLTFVTELLMKRGYGRNFAWYVTQKTQPKYDGPHHVSLRGSNTGFRLKKKKSEL